MASNGMEIVLITGANTGLGFEIAKKFLKEHAERFYVLVGARNPSKGEAAVEDLHSQGLKRCEFLEIDVSKDDSIATAASTVEQKFGRLDVLHANAGIAPEANQAEKRSLSKLITEAIEINVAGAAQTAEAFMPLLSKANNPRLIFMSSGLGSLERCHAYSNELWPAYSASKAALNMIMLYFYHVYPAVKVNACSPGFRVSSASIRALCSDM